MTKEQLTELRLALGLLGDILGTGIEDTTICSLVAEAREKVENVVHQHMSAVEPRGECICPNCGLRHGGSNVDGGF